ncbi:MAG: hypothetical protein RIB67_07720 [Miltoncostaeaceae bacterium]
MGERDDAEVPIGTHCEWCGADFEKEPRPTRPKAPAPPPVTTGAEPPTHCEWCGAEYPVPGSD